MNQTLSVLLGAGVCCFVPFMTFLAGMYYARYGLPVAITWRGLHKSEEEE